MTIQEAINSEKKFRRVDDRDWFAKVHLILGFDNEDILATDWEVLVCEKHNAITDEWNNAVQGCPSCPLVEEKQQPECVHVGLVKETGDCAKCGVNVLPDVSCFFDDSIEKKIDSVEKLCTCDKWLVLVKGCKCGGV